MTVRLETALRRELEVEGKQYTLTITPQGLKLVPKGRRNGTSLAGKPSITRTGHSPPH